MRIFWIIAIFVSFSHAFGQRKWHYSVLLDDRASAWPSLIQEVPPEAAGLFEIRSPILNISISADFSEPRDIDLLQALFTDPLPAEIFVYPSVSLSSPASSILGKCFDTIAFDEEGRLDSVRVRDYIRSLFLLAELHGSSPIDGSAGKRITERASVLICKLYTQEFSVISDWIDQFQIGAIEFSNSIQSLPRLITINGLSFPATVPIQTVLHSLVEIQHESIRRIRNVYDEL